MEDDHDNSTNQLISRNKKQHRQSSSSSSSQQVTTDYYSNPKISVLGYDISNLPDSMLLEIFSRLPLKSIFKFKSVCKHWLTLISQPSLSRLYLSRSPSSVRFIIMYRYIHVSKFQHVLDRFRPEFYNPPKSSSSVVLFLSSFQEQQQQQPHLNQFKVLAVSHGLILCCSLRPLIIYYVCDPVTRQWVTLPRGSDLSSTNTHPVFFGEGLVSRVNQDNVVTGYTVVRVELLNWRTNYLGLQVFSSETGKWVGYKVPCSRPIGLMKHGGSPISFNGILHWFVYDHGMVAFDPHQDPKSCRLVRLPNDREVETDEGIYRLCDECQGKLRFFEVTRDSDSRSFYCFRMWVMKDYEKGEWCSEFKVTCSDLWSCDPELNSLLPKARFLPLSFHPFDLDVVYLRCVELACVVSYSVQNKRLDVASKPIGGLDDQLTWRRVIPFVIPSWPTPVPIPPVQSIT